MTAIRMLCALLTLLCLPLSALAEEAPEDSTSPGAEPEDADSEQGEAPAPAEEVAVDPLTARMQELVAAYYEGIEVEASPDELNNGLESVQMMVLSGTGIQAIADAVTVATRLHTPGRRVPFEIAVPLRVGTAVPTDNSVEQTEEEKETARVEVSAESLLSPQESARRIRVREAEEKHRARYGLYRQWRERTRVPRTLISVGVPLLVTSYITGFATSGVALLAGAPLTHGQAWLSAIPVVGTAIIAGITDGALAGMTVLTILQGTGVALLVVGLLLPVDYPYDKDPTALKIGKKPGGKHALELRFQPAPTGAGIVGRF